MRRRIGAILTFATLGVMPLGGVSFAQALQPRTLEPLPPMAPMLPLSPSTMPSPDAAGARYYRPIGGTNTAAPLLPYDYKNPTPDGTSLPATSQPAYIPRENTYLTNRPGRFARNPDGKSWQFTPDAAMANAVSMPALTVLPSRALEALESTTKGANEARFAVSGTITIYNAQPFLLIDTASPTDQAATLAAERTEPPPAVSSPATRPSTPLPADQMVNQLLRPGGAPAPARPIQSTTGPARDVTSGASAIAPSASILTVMREGTFLVDRTGRLTRTRDGQSWEFTFDTDGRSMKDPPVLILPNLKLMLMEQASKSSNRDLRFRITGMVTEYAGRNYILLEKFVVVPDVTQQF